jgi:hypothetical protein
VPKPTQLPTLEVHVDRVQTQPLLQTQPLVEYTRDGGAREDPLTEDPETGELGKPFTQPTGFAVRVMRRWRNEKGWLTGRLRLLAKLCGAIHCVHNMCIWTTRTCTVCVLYKTYVRI